MRGHDARVFGLLPALGLCSCVVASEQPSAALVEPEAWVDPGWIEVDSPHQPLTTFEAARRSARASLARHEFASARGALSVALSYEPDAQLLNELRLGQADALIGLGELRQARELLAELRRDEDETLQHAVDARYMRVRELEHAVGVGSCALELDTAPRQLTRHDDFLSAWNDLREGLPADAALPIPTDADAARLQLCRSCGAEDIAIASLSFDDDVVEGLILAHPDGAVSVLPALQRSEWSSCADEGEVTFERRGDLLWVRAFGDTREDFDVSDWDLGDTANLGPQNPSPGYFGSTRSSDASSGYASSGYASSGYASSGYASSGYASSGYASSGYVYGYGYGCGYAGYDYDYAYEDCVITRSIERDVFIDLRSGEVVLEVVRDGAPTSPLGTVEFVDGHVQIDACGVEQRVDLPGGPADVTT